MKLKQLAAMGSGATKASELSMENIGVNKFRVSIPLSWNTTGQVYSRVATVEASSEKTKAGVTRIMLKCTIPYLTQMIDADGNPDIDTQKSARDFTAHIVFTVPSTMAKDMVDPTMSAQAAQALALACSFLKLGIVDPIATSGSGSAQELSVPVQVGPESVDGVKAFPLAAAASIPAESAGGYTLKNITPDFLKGSMLGRVISGLSPIDVNTDIDLVFGQRDNR